MQLTMVTVDGVEHPVDATSSSIFASLKDFHPVHHRRLTLRCGSIIASAWPCTHVADALGTACLRVELDGETRWLGRVRESGTFTIEGVVVPRTVEVPVTWVSSVLPQFVRSSQWPTQFPWYAGAPLGPLNMWCGESYSFAKLKSALNPVSLLDALRVELREHLSADPTPAAADELIAELRRVGHDLWSWDTDGDWRQWGADYMRSAEGTGLRLSVAPPWVGDLGFDK